MFGIFGEFRSNLFNKIIRFLMRYCCIDSRTARLFLHKVPFGVLQVYYKQECER